MKNYFYTFVTVTFLCTTAIFADTAQDINNALRSGNFKAISTLFYASVELNLPGNEGLYSKAQAELILKDFFQKNSPKNFTAKHGGESKDGAKFNIGNLETSSGNFRTYFFLKKEGDALLIKELRIEKE